MCRRYLWLAIAVVLVLTGVALTLGAGGLSGIARRVAINRLQAMTGRAVSIDRVDVELRRGHVAVHGARVLDVALPWTIADDVVLVDPIFHVGADEVRALLFQE